MEIGKMTEALQVSCQVYGLAAAMQISCQVAE